MDMTEYIKLCLVKRKLSARQLAASLDPESDTSAQNLNNKMKRNNFKIQELEAIADKLDCDLQVRFIDRKTNEPLI